MMTRWRAPALQTAAAPWAIWGRVRAFAGGLILSSDAASGFQTITDAVDPVLLVGPYHPGVAGVLIQHA